jgi:hypothetical protein
MSGTLSGTPIWNPVGNLDVRLEPGLEPVWNVKSLWNPSGTAEPVWNRCGTRRSGTGVAPSGMRLESRTCLEAIGNTTWTPSERPLEHITCGTFFALCVDSSLHIQRTRPG